MEATRSPDRSSLEWWSLPERQVKLMKSMIRILLAGLLMALCLAGISAAEELVCSGSDDIWAPVIISSISAQTATPTDVITLTATVDDTNTGTSEVQAFYRMTMEGVVPVDIIPSDPMMDWPSMASDDPPGPVMTFSTSIDLSPYHLVPGVYTVCINGRDACGWDSSDAGECYALVIYDPEGGFVTGGGWIDSPAGASTVDPLLSGRANFGFVSKYLKGATVPSGQTQFQFRAGNLNFHSSSYNWLVVAGAKAQYKGTGTINNEGSYRFMLTAIDGQLPGGGGVDRFRIRIWTQMDPLNPLSEDLIIYDNQIGDADTSDPTTAIAGGSIVIHKN